MTAAAVRALLASKTLPVTDFEGWDRLDAHERSLGAPAERERIKLHSRERDDERRRHPLTAEPPAHTFAPRAHESARNRREFAYSGHFCMRRRRARPGPRTARRYAASRGATGAPINLVAGHRRPGAAGGAGDVAEGPGRHFTGEGRAGRTRHRHRPRSGSGRGRGEDPGLRRLPHRPALQDRWHRQRLPVPARARGGRYGRSGRRGRHRRGPGRLRHPQLAGRVRGSVARVCAGVPGTASTPTTPSRR